MRCVAWFEVRDENRCVEENALPSGDPSLESFSVQAQSRARRGRKRRFPPACQRRRQACRRSCAGRHARGTRSQSRCPRLRVSAPARSGAVLRTPAESSLGFFHVRSPQFPKVKTLAPTFLLYSYYSRYVGAKTVSMIERCLRSYGCSGRLRLAAREVPLIAVRTVVREENARHLIHRGVGAGFGFAAVTVFTRTAARDIAILRFIDALPAAQPPLEGIEVRARGRHRRVAGDL